MRKNKRCKSKSKSKSESKSSSTDGVNDDWLRKLPDDILHSIVSLLTMKEAARTSVLSHRWKHIWHYVSILNFEDPLAAKRIYETFSVIGKERTNFVSWVNDVVSKHKGLDIDEFRVCFELDNSCEPDINKWLDFAFEKHVKKLDVDFLVYPTLGNFQRYSLPLERLPPDLATNNRYMTSLRFHQVDITSEAMEHILNSLPLLQHLSISMSFVLTSLRISGTMSSKLTYLKVFRCDLLEVLDISTPKLVSFQYIGCPLKLLRVQNASSLSTAIVGAPPIVPAQPSVRSIVEYFPQLEFLHLEFKLSDELNLGMKHVPALPNLKHLRIGVIGSGSETLLGWISFIEASPLLQKLTLKFSIHDYIVPDLITKPKRDEQPIKCLKSLEITGFVGGFTDMEFVMNVLAKAPALKEVTVRCNESTNPTHRGVKKLRRKLPKGAKLILMEEFSVIDYFYNIYDISF